MKKKTGLIVAGIAAAVIIVPSLNKGSDTPNSSDTTCPTAIPAGAKQMGTVNFQTGATHVTGGGGIKITGGGGSWQAKNGKEVDLTIDLREVEPPQDKKNEAKPSSSSKQTNIYNGGIKPVTLVDTAQKCALTLGSGSRQAYEGADTVKVFVTP